MIGASASGTGAPLADGEGGEWGGEKGARVSRARVRNTSQTAKLRHTSRALIVAKSTNGTKVQRYIAILVMCP
jgi:hypothetical protein